MRKLIRLLIPAVGLIVLTAMLAMPETAVANPNVRYIGPSKHYLNPPEGVRCVQRVVGAAVDGQFGQETYDKVRRFQQQNKLSVDGIVGPLTGSVILTALPEGERFSCAKYVPSTFYLMDDNGQLAEGGQVYNQQANGDLGGGVWGGKPLGKCLVDGIKGQIMGPGRLVKILWKRRMPTLSEWKAAPNPILFTGEMIYCSALGPNE